MTPTGNAKWGFATKVPIVPTIPATGNSLQSDPPRLRINYKKGTKTFNLKGTLTNSVSSLPVFARSVAFPTAPTGVYYSTGRVRDYTGPDTAPGHTLPTDYRHYVGVSRPYWALYTTSGTFIRSGYIGANSQYKDLLLSVGAINTATNVVNSLRSAAIDLDIPLPANSTASMLAISGFGVRWECVITAPRGEGYSYSVRAEMGTSGTLNVTTVEKELSGVVSIPKPVLRQGYKGNIGV